MSRQGKGTRADLTAPPPASEGVGYTNTRPYSKRGWCWFERAAAMVVKNRNALWDASKFDGATSYGIHRNSAQEDRALLKQLRAGRGPPVSPDVMGSTLRRLVKAGDLGFTAKADL